MKLRHEEVKDRMVDYASGAAGLPADERLQVEQHLRECRQCAEELTVLRALGSFEAEDPGGLFFETLPQRVSVSVRQQKARQTFFSRRLAPAFAAMLVVVAAYLYMGPGQDENGLNGFYSNNEADYLAEIYSPVFVTSYEGLSHEDLPSIADSIIEENIDFDEETMPWDTYHQDVSSLGQDDLTGLYEALGKIKTNNKGKQEV